MRKCCVCGKPVTDEESYEVLGYSYHEQCLPRRTLEVKQRCFYCHKIMRKGDEAVSRGDLGCGYQDELVCDKCTKKHFKKEDKK